MEAARMVAAAKREEVTLTLLPGWNLRQVADYLVLKGFASSTMQVLALTGKPAKLLIKIVEVPRLIPPSGLKFIEKKPSNVSYEGYLAPETLRVFKNATLQEVLSKFITERNKELESNRADIESVEEKYGTDDGLNTLLTMASIVEREANTNSDRHMVADILWRRYEKNWALQVDSSVHYAVDRTGDVFTTAQERTVDSSWNTYKYPGLPPGPICNPSVESIKAALHPEQNSYWYFLTGSDGKMHYGRTLEEHNVNRAKYL